MVWAKPSGLQRRTSRASLWQCGVQHACTLPRASHHRKGFQLLLDGELCLASKYCCQVLILVNQLFSNLAICRFLLTRKVLALKEYFPLTSTDGPWLIRNIHAFGAEGTGAHFVQKRYMEGSMWRRVDLEFMIGKLEIHPLLICSWFLLSRTEAGFHVQ